MIAHRAQSNGRTMTTTRLILVTGATGKVGQTFIRRLLADPAHSGDRVRALCHNRLLPTTDRIEVASGSIAERAVVERAVAGVTHVLHLATCKETPDDVMDVTVKCTTSGTLRLTGRMLIRTIAFGQAYFARSNHTATLLPDGTVLVAGQPCTLVNYRASINYQVSGMRVQYTCTRADGQTVKAVEVVSGDFAWDEDIAGAELVPGKGTATPKPAARDERLIRLWSGPQGAPKAAVAAGAAAIQAAAAEATAAQAAAEAARGHDAGAAGAGEPARGAWKQATSPDGAGLDQEDDDPLAAAEPLGTNEAASPPDSAGLPGRADQEG